MNNNEKIFHGRVVVYFMAIVLPLLLLASCSPRLSFIITAQYVDRPVLIGQYRMPGEKIGSSVQGTPIESKQGTAVSDLRLNKLSRDILMANPKKTDVLVIQEIEISSSTWDAFSGDIYFENNSIVKGKILSDR